MRKKIYLLLTVISFCIVIGCDREANSNKSYLLSAVDHIIIVLSEVPFELIVNG